ncbi:hypothetical protein AVEN_226502-1 [Araneus ventricosus]|uniref:Uncharacterized protein n=1 Tax=Araneus ventricosus TaxID=182803 RepID=A0A4Y2I3Z4_ARAVE|nr:hypothetical protein AVEN_226502-1 [Araneus ventricosus]
MKTFVTTLYPCRLQGFQSLSDKLSLLYGSPPPRVGDWFLSVELRTRMLKERFRKAPASEAGDPNEKCSCRIDVVDREGSRRIFLSVLLLAAKGPDAYSELCFVKLAAKGRNIYFLSAVLYVILVFVLNVICK